MKEQQTVAVPYDTNAQRMAREKYVPPEKASDKALKLWNNGLIMEDQLQHTYDQDELRRNPAQLKVSAQGRVVIPVEMRRELGIDPGEVMVARVEGDKLILEKKSAVLARLRKRFAHIPRDVSLADELIAERREEVRRRRSQARRDSGT